MIKLELQAFSRYDGNHDGYFQPVDVDEWLNTLGTYNDALSHECQEWTRDNCDGYAEKNEIMLWLAAKYGEENVGGYGGEPWDVETHEDSVIGERIRYIWASTPDGEMLIHYVTGFRYDGPWVWILDKVQSETAVLDWDRAHGECENGHRITSEAGLSRIYHDGSNDTYRVYELIRIDRDADGYFDDSTAWLACPACGGKTEMFTSI